MIEVELVEACAKHGLGVFFGVFGSWLMYLLIKHFLKLSNEVILRSDKQQEKWQEVIAKQTEAAQRFQDQVCEAHRYQREEHKQMIEILGRINGYKQ